LKPDDRGVLGGLDQRPPQVWRALLGEIAASLRLRRVEYDRVEAGNPHDLVSTAEAARGADLGEQMTGDDRADPVDRLQRKQPLIDASEAAQLALHLRHLY
jgi:hypothetical protein